MPVSLCEWRVRIGTFVHWIRDYEIKERKERLLKERIRRMKILCERLKAKMDDSEQDSEDGENVGKSRHDISNPRKSNQCPHKTTDIKSPGDSSCIKDLLTSCDQCIQDLLTQNYSHIEKILTQSDTSTEHLLGQNDSCLKDLLLVPNSSRNHQHKASGSSLEELMQNDSKIKKLITQSDSNIKFLLNSLDSGTDDMLLSAKSCRNYQPVLSDSAVNDLFSRADSDSRILLVPSNTELKMQSDSHVQDLLKPRDTSINELLTASDSSVKDLLTPRDSSTNEFPTPKDSSVKDSVTPRDCWINELPTSRDASIKESPTPRDYSINELLTASDSSITELLTQEDCLINELLTPKDPSFYEVITPRDFPRNDLSRPRYSITESPTPRDYVINELLTVSDSSITGLLTKEDSLINELLTPNDPAVYEVLMPRDSSLDELPVPGSIKESLMPTNSSLPELLKPADVSMNELLKPKDSSVSELLSPRDFLVDESLTPGDSNIRKLLTLREQMLTKSGIRVHEHQKGFCNEELVDNELKEMKSSYAYRKEHLIGVGSMSPVEDTKNDDSARHRPRFLLSTSTSDCNVAENEPAEQKEISNESSNSSSICTQSLDAPVDGIYNPCIAELLLAKAGDVELNPGPLHGSIDRVLQESELILLAKEVPGNCYTELCIGLGFSYMESQNVLTKHLMDITGALIEFFCRWKLKQRDGTDCRAILARILGNADMGELGTKLLAGGYLRTETSPSAPDTPQPLIDMTEEQVVQCGHDLQAFYREQMCKIKTDPLDFNSVLEFETIYTNLTLLKSKTPLDYTALLTTKVNGVIPKRLMVEGEGGVGKTTFCSKIAWDWANRSPQFKQFNWVLVIPLRKVIKGQTVGDIVKTYLSDSNSVTPAQIDNYIRSQPTKVLIVLDGLDEYDGDLLSPEYSDISQILRREKFKECIVLVTTRPWRADQIKCNEDLNRTYAFIAVKGFSAENVSSYIMKYFVDDEKAGKELIRFIEVNDIIRENMAPFPIYVAMLCILWKYSDSEKRETIRSLKTFSQLFNQMIIFLRDHYVSKVIKVLQKPHLDNKLKNTKKALLEIGSIAFSGLLKKKLAFTEEHFVSCKEAMETCCRIGVLSQENKNISRWDRSSQSIESITMSVFFPHKLFQEYIAALHLDFLFKTDRDKYNNSLDEVIGRDAQEFRYLLYFTAAQGQEIGLDILKRIQENEARGGYGNPFCRQPDDDGRKRQGYNDFLVDVTFEAYNKDTAKSVGQRIFAEEKILTINEDMPAHTMSGYLFIMEQHGMETLIFQGRTCGPTVSRDLADVLCSSSSLSRLEFYGTTLNEDFYRLMQDQTSSAGVISVKELYVDAQFLGDLHRFDVTVGDLFPGLQQLRLTSPQTVRPGFVERLTHPKLSVLSIESVRYDGNRSLEDGEEWPVPFIGEPASLGQLFSSSFPHLTSLTFRDLVIGNVRCKAVLHSLRNHKRIKSISFTSCFTDDSLDCLASEMSKENGITVSLQHDSAQQSLDFGANRSRLTTDLMDALCHRTCVRKLVVKGSGMVRSREWFPELQGREVQSKGVKSVNSVKELYVDHTFLGDLERFRVTVGDLFPGLQQLGFTSLKTVTPGFVERLTHPNLPVLFIKADSTRQTSYKDMKEEKEWPVPLIGEPASLGQLFSSSFPQLTSLSFKGLVIGNKRCEAILHSLRNHKHMKSISFISCFTDDELYFLARQISKENRIAITLDHDLKQRKLACVLTADLMDALCHRTCIRKLYINNQKKGFMVRSRECFSEVQGTEVDSKIQTFTVVDLKLGDDQSASCCLGRFICLLPCLTDLTINKCSFHDEFYTEIADAASSSKIQTFMVVSLELYDDQSESCYLGRLICLLPCLTDLVIEGCSFHDKFYKEIADHASSSKIRTFSVTCLYLPNDELASCRLGQFICLLPCLTDLRIKECCFHDEFYKEIADRASSSKIQTFSVTGLLLPNDELASCCLGKFICLLPCLTDLRIEQSFFLDEFYIVIADRASSSKNPYFRNNKHLGMLREWPGRKKHGQQLLKQRHQAANPAYQHNPRSREQQGPVIPQPSAQYQDYHPRRIHSNDEEVQQFPNAGLRETSEHAVAQTSQPLEYLFEAFTVRTSRNVIHSFTSERRHSVGMTRMLRYGDDPDRPSTSGLSSAHSRIGTASVTRKDRSVVGKRSHSASDSDHGTVSTSESKKRQSGKRRTKTDRNPDSP